MLDKQEGFRYLVPLIVPLIVGLVYPVRSREKRLGGWLGSHKYSLSLGPVPHMCLQTLANPNPRHTCSSSVMQPSCCKYSSGSAELCLLLILFVTVSVPGSDVPHQDALDGAGVGISQYLR